MSLGVPSKLKGCVPKVDRYSTLYIESKETLISMSKVEVASILFKRATNECTSYNHGDNRSSGEMVQ